MITARSLASPYQTQISDSLHVALADTTADKGGSHTGFRPHDLLEAALAACVNMSVRMYAEHHGIAIEGVCVQVNLERGNPEESVFQYDVEIQGDITADQREALLRASRACPVRRTLSRRIRFECGGGA